MPAPLLLGAAAGVAAMYLFDPFHGRRRRAVLRDRIASRVTRFDAAAVVAARDLGNRTRGLAAELRALFRSAEAPDEVLVERVRARLGRVVSHAGAIEVTASGGRVTLAGPILAHEQERLLRTARSVGGVREVENRLEVHESARGIPALQGGTTPPDEHIDIFQHNWSPATRAIATTAGSALLLHALTEERTLPALVSAVAGTALLARATANVPLLELAGLGEERTFEVHKTLHVEAPIEQVFEALSRVENFPRFMRNVQEVKLLGDGSSRWSVAGPGGIPVEWHSAVTRYEPNRLLGWRTLPGSTVRHEGTIRFEPDGEGTRLVIHMRYHPPAGALGHGVARLLAADPKSELDQDLMRMKVFLETGKPARDAAAARH